MLNLESGQYLGSISRKYSCEGIVISETEYDHRVFEGWHAHQNRHLTFIVTGGNREQRKHRVVEALPGVVVAYNGGELHRNLDTVHPSKNINVEIEESFFAEYSLNSTLFEQLAPTNPEVKFSILKAFRECLSKQVESVMTIHSIMLNLLVPHDRPISNERPQWVCRVKEAIHDRWEEKLSLKELALIAGVHAVTISKNFPKYFSCSVGEYMRRVKIEKSLELIKQTDTTLTEIAVRCGFADQSHFIRTFKSETGFLPKEFKKL